MDNLKKDTIDDDIIINIAGIDVSLEKIQKGEVDAEMSKFIFEPEFIPLDTRLVDIGFSHCEATIIGFIGFYLKHCSGKFFFSNEQLSKTTRYSMSSIGHAMMSLKDKGVIDPRYIMKTGGGRTRYITDIKIPDIEKLSFESAKNDVSHRRNDENTKKTPLCGQSAKIALSKVQPLHYIYNNNTRILNTRKKKENIYSKPKERKTNNNLQPAAAGDLKTPTTEEAIKLVEQEKILGNQVNKIFSIFHDIMNPTINFGNKTQRKAAEELIKLIGYKPVEDLATAAANVFYEEYSPKIKNPLELKEKLPNLMAFLNTRNAKRVTVVDRDSETQPEQYI
jgi:hypothetical protein